jgi:ATP diphosphatase
MAPAPPDLQKLVDLVARLRAPDGCPWDREQKLADTRAYLIEEAHEAAAALDAADAGELAAELGDLLFQIAFIGRLAEESGAFTLAQAIDGVYRKMVDRHPHVFGSETLADSEAVRQAWERRKLLREPGRTSLLAGVPGSLPALLAAYRLTQKAAGVGFDWARPADVLAKLDEEIGELRQALLPAAPEIPETPETPGDIAVASPAVREELGDILFTVANLARKLGVDPEAALAAANRKFRHRFARIEQELAARGKTPADASLAEMDDIWRAAKERP